MSDFIQKKIILFVLLALIKESSCFALNSGVFLRKKEKNSKSSFFSSSNFTHKKIIVWPLVGRVSSEFGPRWGKLHKGIDIAACTGTAIFAAQEGLVEFSGVKLGYGKTLIIRHATFKTLYAHCHELLFKKGQRVAKRQVIAHVGSTGKSFGAHLHFEFRSLNDKALNPRFFLPIVAGTI